MKYSLIRVERPSEALLDDFDRNIRPNDKRELLAANTGVREEIEDSIYCADECWAVINAENEYLAVFGRTKVVGYAGNLIWCVGTNKLQRYWFPFVRESRKVLREWAHEYGVLYNAVGSFNTESMRWLSWLGASFGQTIEMGGEEFVCFELYEEDM